MAPRSPSTRRRASVGGILTVAHGVGGSLDAGSRWEDDGGFVARPGRAAGGRRLSLNKENAQAVGAPVTPRRSVRASALKQGDPQLAGDPASSAAAAAGAPAARTPLGVLQTPGVSPSRKKARRSLGRRVSFAEKPMIRHYEKDEDWVTPPDASGRPQLLPPTPTLADGVVPASVSGAGAVADAVPASTPTEATANGAADTAAVTITATEVTATVIVLGAEEPQQEEEETADTPPLLPLLQHLREDEETLLCGEGEAPPAVETFNDGGALLASVGLTDTGESPCAARGGPSAAAACIGGASVAVAAMTTMNLTAIVPTFLNGNVADVVLPSPGTNTAELTITTRAILERARSLVSAVQGSGDCAAGGAADAAGGGEMPVGGDVTAAVPRLADLVEEDEEGEVDGVAMGKEGSAVGFETATEGDAITAALPKLSALVEEDEGDEDDGLEDMAVDEEEGDLAGAACGGPGDGGITAAIPCLSALVAADEGGDGGGDWLDGGGHNGAAAGADLPAGFGARRSAPNPVRVDLMAALTGALDRTTFVEERRESDEKRRRAANNAVLLSLHDVAGSGGDGGGDGGGGGGKGVARELALALEALCTLEPVAFALEFGCSNMREAVEMKRREVAALWPVEAEGGGQAAAAALAAVVARVQEDGGNGEAAEVAVAAKLEELRSGAMRASRRAWYAWRLKLEQRTLSAYEENLRLLGEDQAFVRQSVACAHSLESSVVGALEAAEHERRRRGEEQAERRRRWEEQAERRRRRREEREERRRREAAVAALQPRLEAVQAKEDESRAASESQAARLAEGEAGRLQLEALRSRLKLRVEELRAELAMREAAAAERVGHRAASALTPLREPARKVAAEELLAAQLRLEQTMAVVPFKVVGCRKGEDIGVGSGGVRLQLAVPSVFLDVAATGGRGCGGAEVPTQRAPGSDRDEPAASADCSVTLSMLREPGLLGPALARVHSLMAICERFMAAEVAAPCRVDAAAAVTGSALQPQTVVLGGCLPEAAAADSKAALAAIQRVSTRCSRLAEMLEDLRECLREVRELASARSCDSGRSLLLVFADWTACRRWTVALDVLPPAAADVPAPPGCVAGSACYLYPDGGLLVTGVAGGTGSADKAVAAEAEAALQAVEPGRRWLQRLCETAVRHLVPSLPSV